MAPKAKGLAKAKVRMRRPAGAGARAPGRRRGLDPAMRRPAAVDPPAPRDWHTGAEVALREVSLWDFMAEDHLVVTEGYYFGTKVVFAAKVAKVEAEPLGAHLLVKLTGTTSEELLKEHGTDPLSTFKLHVCPEACGQLETGNRYLHGVKGRRVTPGGEGWEAWMANLEGAVKDPGDDELAALRRRELEVAEKERREAPPDKAENVSSESGSHSSRKKKKKKKKRSKKSRSRKKEVEKARGSAGGKEKKDVKDTSKGVKKLDGRHPIQASQKAPQDLFSGTGLDLEDRPRKRVLKRARRYLKEGFIEFVVDKFKKQPIRGGRSGRREPVCRDGKGPFGSSDVSGCTGLRSTPTDEAAAAYRGRRGSRCDQQQAHWGPVLQAGAGEEGKWANGSGTSYADYGVGCPDKGATSSGGGHHLPEDQILRNLSSGHALVNLTEDGDCGARPGRNSPKAGTSLCSQGIVRGQQNEIPGESGARFQRQHKGKGKGKGDGKGHKNNEKGDQGKRGDEKGGKSK